MTCTCARIDGYIIKRRTCPQHGTPVIEPLLWEGDDS